MDCNDSLALSGDLDAICEELHDSLQCSDESFIRSTYSVKAMGAEIFIIVAMLAFVCFQIGGGVFNPPPSEKKKSPEQEFGEAITKYIKHLKKELKEESDKPK